MVNELNNLTMVTQKNLKPAALTLAKAFQDYPESVYFVPDEVKRRKQQPRIYRMFLKGVISTGEVYATSPKMEGVAVWKMVDKKHPAWKPGFSFRWWWVSLFTDKESNQRRKAYFEYFMEVRVRVAPDRYWYLQAIGVDPDYQGKGYAGALLKPMLARADKEGLPVYLETQLKKNVPFYEHFGFKVVEEGMIPGSTVCFWAMVKNNV
jgi:GNAT superfamily N-acetyltransferase